MYPIERRREYWSRNVRLTWALLVVWFGASFVVTFYARDLNFDFFGWPFAFYVAAQGAPLVYLVLVCVYAWRMNRLDRDYGVAEPDE